MNFGDYAARTGRDGKSGRLGGEAEKLLQVLAGDEAPPADLDVGQVAAAHLVMRRIWS